MASQTALSSSMSIRLSPPVVPGSILPLFERDEANGEMPFDHAAVQQRVLRSAPCTEHRNHLTITPKWIIPRRNRQFVFR